jgi:cytochrome c oxidase assembly protein subunit 15
MGVNPLGTVSRRDAWAWAAITVVANTVIVITGGLVRLTGSGLGCPTWPTCTDESFVPHRELGWHGVVEFGNRMLTYVLVAVAVATLVAVWRWSGATPKARTLAVLLAAGIPAQAILGGVTVLTDLNPWIVALHFMLSMLLIAGGVVLAVEIAGEPPQPVGLPRRVLISALYLVAWVTIYLGTVVTGSGPHAGDEKSPRNGFGPVEVSGIHAASVWALVLITVLLVALLWRSPLRSSVLLVLGVELAQGAIGYWQYYEGLPIWLVSPHMLGASLLMITSTRLSTAATR